MARGEWNAARDGQFGWLAKSAGFRRNPQEHAGTGAIRQEKTPTENGWGFVIGGAGVHRNDDRRASIHAGSEAMTVPMYPGLIPPTAAGCA